MSILGGIQLSGGVCAEIPTQRRQVANLDNAAKNESGTFVPVNPDGTPTSYVPPLSEYHLGGGVCLNGQVAFNAAPDSWFRPTLGAQYSFSRAGLANLDDFKNFEADPTYYTDNQERLNESRLDTHTGLVRVGMSFRKTSSPLHINVGGQIGAQGYFAKNASTGEADFSQETSETFDPYIRDVNTFDWTAGAYAGVEFYINPHHAITLGVSGLKPLSSQMDDSTSSATAGADSVTRSYHPFAWQGSVQVGYHGTFK